jgi:XisI protein
MDNVKETLKRVLAGYTGEGLNGYSYLTSSADERVFTSVSVGRADGKEFVFADLIVRLIGNRIVIDHDANSDPLVDALVQAGIPRERIVLAYAGEPAPETA